MLTFVDGIDEIIPINRNFSKSWQNFQSFRNTLKQLKAEHWDYVIDFQGLFRSGIFGKFAGNGQNTYGFAHAREGASFFYKHKVEVPDTIVHALEKNLYLMNQVFDWNEPYLAPHFSFSKEAKDFCKDQFKDFQGYKRVAVAPLSRWESKSWPNIYFLRQMEKLSSELKTIFWLVGAAAEKDRCDALEKMCVERNIPVLNLAGKTNFEQMLACLQSSQLFYTNDSGPMHMAAALNVPLIACYGPTSAEKTGPYSPSAHVFKSSASCAPCFKRECPLSEQICYTEGIDEALISKTAISILNGEK
ncbi:MAG: glycosyltransferase family 9 protein [Lentisphaeria bacterium]|nr:glycosyltransferase family 9 protein [Lentisphaeria bacterium]